MRGPRSPLAAPWGRRGRLLLATPLVVVAVLLVNPWLGGVPPRPPGTDLATAVVGDHRIHPPASLFTVVPASGPVGTTVDLNGSGFLRNLRLQVLFDSNLTNVTCSTDANGSFPGTSGTPCTVVVPATTTGAQTIAVSYAWTAGAGRGVGGSPEGIAEAPGSSLLFVTNSGTGNVTILNATANAIVGNVRVGTTPYGVAEDPVRHWIYVANSASSNVSVIAESTRIVIASIPTGSRPFGVVADPAHGLVYVSQANRIGDLLAISDLNNSVVARIPVGSLPGVPAYDPKLGEIFVPNAGADTVSVVNDTNQSVVATIAVSGQPDDVAYDAHADRLYVADPAGNAVSVLDPDHNMVVARVPVGRLPSWLLSLAGTGEVLVTDASSQDVRVLNDSTNTVVATAGTGTRPEGLTYDPTSRVTYAVNAGSDNLTLLVHPDGVATRPGAFTVEPAFALRPNYGLPGTVIRVTGTGFAAHATIAVRFNGTRIAMNCATDAAGSFPGRGPTPCTFPIPAGGVRNANVTLSDGVSTAYEDFAEPAALALAPGAAFVGGLVIASGQGYPAAGNVSFDVDGVGVASPCAADATGSFPGGTHTPCTFSLPSLPGGNTTVAAVGPWTVAGSTAVGLTPDAVAVDTAHEDVYVADSGAGSISVLSALTDQLTATIPVGRSPVALAYDAARGEVFVADSTGRAVSVINDTNLSVVATLSAAGCPDGIAYDPGLGEIAVADRCNATLTIVNDRTDQAIAWPSVGGRPGVVAFDPARGEFYVANDGNATVSVVNDTTDRVVATVATGAHPAAIAVDPTHGTVYVANAGSQNISVLSDANLAVVATFGAGVRPAALVYDAGTGELLVANDIRRGNLSVLASSTGTPIGTVALGREPDALAVDPVTGDLFVANGLSGNVSIVGALTYGLGALTVQSGLAVRSPTGSVDAGQSVTLLGSGFGTETAVVSVTLGTLSLRCASASVGRCAGGNLTTDANGAFTAQFPVPSVPTSGSYPANVTDGLGHRADANLTVFTDPAPGTITAARLTLDVGQSDDLGIAPSGGSGGDRFVWSGLPAGCSGSTAQLNCTPTAAGTDSVVVQVTDSNGVTNTSAPLILVVASRPTVTTPTAVPGTGTVDAGQNVTFSASATGGPGGPFVFAWSGLPPGCASATAIVTCAGGLLPSGPYSITVTVTDGNGGRSAPSAPLDFLVNPDPSVGMPSASPPSLDVGQAVTLSIATGGGTGALTTIWRNLPTGCTGSAGDSVVCTVGAAGTFALDAVVTDAAGFSVVSPTVNLSVAADPTASVALSASQTDVGRMVTLTAVGNPGAGADEFTWLGLPTGCSGTAVTVLCVPSKAGDFSPSVRVVDRNGGSGTSSPMTLVVAPRLVVLATPSATTVPPGQPVPLVAVVSGGSPPFAFAWSFGDGGASSGSSVNHTYAAPGSFVATLWVNDSVGASALATVNVTVQTSAAPSAAASLVPEVALAALVVAAVVAVALYVRRRRARPEPTEAVDGDDPDDGPEPGTEYRSEDPPVDEEDESLRPE